MNKHSKDAGEHVQELTHEKKHNASKHNVGNKVAADKHEVASATPKEKNKQHKKSRKEDTY